MNVVLSPPAMDVAPKAVSTLKPDGTVIGFVSERSAVPSFCTVNVVCVGAPAVVVPKSNEPVPSSMSVLLCCTVISGVGIVGQVRPTGGAVKNPLKSMSALTLSPCPDPAPLGPSITPHQLPVNVCVTPLTASTAVSSLLTIQLPVTLCVPLSW